MLGSQPVNGLVGLHGGDGNDVVLTEHGNAVGHAVHHANAMTAGDWLFA
jgi:hypothetical protein